MDRKTENQVWQRVLSPQGGAPVGADLTRLLSAALEEQQLCRATASRHPRDRGRTLLEPIAENVDCLRGLCRLSGLPLPRPTGAAMQQADPARCLALARQAASEYTARTIDREYGLVFGEMARREQLICARLAQLLGQENITGSL